MITKYISTLMKYPHNLYNVRNSCYLRSFSQKLSEL